MARPRHDPNREDTKLRLLRAAEDAFGRHGFAGARLADIARVAGVRRPSLLHHFASKRLLHEAVVARAFLDLRREIEAASDDIDDFDALLSSLTRRLVAFAAERPGVAGLIVRELLAGGPDGSSSDDGRGAIEREMLPLVDHLETLVRAAAGTALATSFPVRDAIMAMMVAHMAKVASGGPSPLWPNDATPLLTRALFFGAALVPATD